ncbi:MAG: lactate utilization protein B, partial [Limnohabitans sp.]|nr:lactate utilization protein B [Limnohabitans sp.]
IFGRDFGPDYDDLRTVARDTKQYALDHLDELLERFIANAEQSGAKVHAATTGREACDIALEIARKHRVEGQAQSCVKSKSMVTEEIGLLPAFEAAGIKTLETDLGEFILQIDGDAPSHIVTPMIHKDRVATAKSFVRELGARYTEDPTELTMIAREHMRGLYRAADIGVSGANFLLADEGAAVICTNEGNFDLSVGGPPVHIVFVGIEKLIRGARDLAPFLKLLARSGTAQPLTVYTSFVRGPRRAGEHGGPKEVHFVLVDAGRVGVLASEKRDLLRCIRCGACLNACPVYRKVGGHSYGSMYAGPIGAVLTPELERAQGGASPGQPAAGLTNYPDLPRASSLCGACYEACPVKIDIPKFLLHDRVRLRAQGLSPKSEARVLALWRWLAERPRLFRLAIGAVRLHARMLGRKDGEGERAWLSRAPGPGAGWTQSRDLGIATSESFRDWFAKREKSRGAQ